MNREELLRGLSPEQLEKARECKSNKELLEYAKTQGLELTEEQLNQVNGGACRIEKPANLLCPSCGGTRIEAVFDHYARGSRGVFKCVCLDCGERFEAE